MREIRWKQESMKQAVLTVGASEGGGACVEDGGAALLTMAEVGCDDEEGPPAVPEGLLPRISM
jgi:hypothetical protein